jgi:hypothetical protein
MDNHLKQELEEVICELEEAEERGDLERILSLAFKIADLQRKAG